MIIAGLLVLLGAWWIVRALRLAARRGQRLSCLGLVLAALLGAGAGLGLFALLSWWASSR